GRRPARPVRRGRAAPGRDRGPGRVLPPTPEGRPMSTESELLQRVPDGLFIGGEWRSAEGGRTLDVFDPATGDRVRTIADATPADGMAALDAAVEAFPAWAA